MKRPTAWLATLNDERELAYDLLRVYLGIALFARGMLFILNADPLMQLSGIKEGAMWQVLVMHYIAPAHMMGGALLALGLLTRLAAIAQIPILFGAVFFVHWGDGLLTAGQGFELAALTLFALVLFAVFGPGHMSMDARIFPKQVEGLHGHGHGHGHAHARP